MEHVPLTRVAEEADVNRVSIYHEFGGEENLLLELFSQLDVVFEWQKTKTLYRYGM